MKLLLGLEKNWLIEHYFIANRIWKTKTETDYCRLLKVPFFLLHSLRSLTATFYF